MLKIPCLLLIGIITFTNGKPSHDGYSQVLGIKKLLQKLTNQQGFYNIELSHHEDGPNTHHIDRARIYHQDDLSYVYNNNGQLPHGQDNRQRKTNINTQQFSRMGDYDIDEINKIMEMETDRMCRKKPKEFNCNPKTRPCPPKRSPPLLDKCVGRMGAANKGENEASDVGEDADEVLLFLNGLDKNLELKTDINNIDKRSRDDNDRNYRNYLHCSGRSCNRSNPLRCRGGKCGIDNRESRDNRENGEYRDNRQMYITRCKGIMCSRSRKDDENDLKYALNRIMNTNVDDMMFDPDIKNVLAQINVEDANVYRFG